MNSEDKLKIRKMRSKGDSYAAIADIIGVSANTIKSFCRRNNLQNTEFKDEKFQNECKNCNKKLIILEKQKTKIFCCDKCRWQWWDRHRDRVSRKAVTFKCKNCGQNFESYSKRLFCKHPCYISWRFNIS